MPEAEDYFVLGASLDIVIPGCAERRRPGIHTPDGGYGFRARRCATPRNDDDGETYCPFARWSNALSTASVMAVTPVWMVGFGTGANRGE